MDNNSTLNLSENCSSISGTTIKTLKKPINGGKDIDVDRPTLGSLEIETGDFLPRRKRKRSWRLPGETRTLLKIDCFKSPEDPEPTGYIGFQEEIPESSDSGSECSYEEYDIRDYERITGRPFTLGSERQPFIAFFASNHEAEENDQDQNSIEKFEQNMQRFGQDRSTRDALQLTLGETEIELMIERIEMKNNLASIQEIPKKEIVRRSHSCQLKPKKEINVQKEITFGQGIMRTQVDIQADLEPCL